MYRVLFMVCESSKEVDQAKALLDLCKEYIVGFSLEEERKLVAEGASFDDQKRSCEMAAYMTHLKMTKHKDLVLRKALSVFSKSPHKEIIKTKAAASIARRLLEYGPPDKEKAFANKVVQLYDASSDQQMKLSYDELNPFTVCASTFKPIYRGRPEVKCPFCQASYSPQFKNTKCRVCLISQVGSSCSGINISAIQANFV